MVRVPNELLFKQFRDGAGGAPPVHITERVMQPEVEPQHARWVQNLTVPEKVATQVAEPDAPADQRRLRDHPERHRLAVALNELNTQPAEDIVDNTFVGRLKGEVQTDD